MQEGSSVGGTVVAATCLDNYNLRRQLHMMQQAHAQVTPLHPCRCQIIKLMSGSVMNEGISTQARDRDYIYLQCGAAL